MSDADRRTSRQNVAARIFAARGPVSLPFSTLMSERYPLDGIDNGLRARVG